MYRSLAFAALRRPVDPSEPDQVAKVAQDIDIVLDGSDVVVDGVDASIEIRGPEVTRAVSAVAAIGDVRNEMRSRQREWIRDHGGGAVEGRDIGTVVWPEADLKVYLVANLAVRAERRSKELTDLEYERVAADMAERDTLDSTRDESPLSQADGAVVIDTTDRSVEDIVAELLSHL